MSSPRTAVDAPTGDSEAAGAEPEPPRYAFKQDRTLTVAGTFLLAFASLGVIYGDIGTSPLYVMNAIFPSGGDNPSSEDVVGACSAIIWSLTILPLIKYSLIALEFGTDGAGEGGPFALFTSIYPPPEETDARALTTYTTASGKGATRGNSGSFLDRHWVHAILFGIVLFGTTLTMSDGLLTPSVSVVSAVQGLSVGIPSLANDIIPISVAILVVLFGLQIAGTHRIAFLFAPIVFIWLLTIAISGIVNITHHPAVFRAFDPSRAVMLFVRTGDFDLLSGVLLAITGVEALFANLGQFSKSAIRIGFAGMVYPCLLLAYLGQSARLIEDPDYILSNVFYQSIPGPSGGGLWWFTFVFANLSAVVASQGEYLESETMITATFSLVHQLTRLHAMPPVKIIHSSDKIQGQVFAPAINILVMIGTIGITVGLGNINGGASLTNAYGFAVSGVLIVTTFFLAIAMVRGVKQLPIYVGVAFFFVFVFFDCLFWGSSLKKVPEGAWVPLGLAVILCVLFLFWSWGRGLEQQFDAEHRYHLNDIISSRPRDEKKRESDGVYTPEGIPSSYEFTLANEDMTPPTILSKLPSDADRFQTPLHLSQGGMELDRVPIFAFFHNSSANTLNGVPHAFSAFLKCYPSLPQVAVFFNLRVVGIPRTSAEERLLVSKLRSFDGIYIATLRLGYRDPIDLSTVHHSVRDRIAAIELESDPAGAGERIKLIDLALERSVTHILPYFHILAAKNGNPVIRFIRTFFIESVYKRIRVNFDETDAFEFGTNEENVLRIGVAAVL